MSENKILVTIAGHDITQQDVDDFIAALPDEQRNYSNKAILQRESLKQLESLYLLEQLGIEMDLENTDEYKLLLSESRRDILSRLALRKLFDKNIATDEEALDFYNKHPRLFRKFEKGQTESTLMSYEEAAEDIKAKISQVKQQNAYRDELMRLEKEYKKQV